MIYLLFAIFMTREIADKFLSPQSGFVFEHITIFHLKLFWSILFYFIFLFFIYLNSSFFIFYSFFLYIFDLFRLSYCSSLLCVLVYTRYHP